MAFHHSVLSKPIDYETNVKGMDGQLTYLILSVLGEPVKRTDMEHELAALREFAEAGSEGYEVRTGNGDGHTHAGFGYVEDPIFV